MPTKKIALITGCSEGGIGAALAHAFADRGYHVYATLRTPSRAGPALTNRSQQPGTNIELLTLDVTDTESIRACAEEVHRKTGGRGLDVLVNNAGADFVMPLLDVDVDEARRLFEVNLWGVLGVTQEFAPMVVKAKGVVVNVNSVAGALGNRAFSGIYFASKAAASSISETLRLEMAPLGVRVVTAMVGSVTTPIHANAGELVLPEKSYYQKIRDIIWTQHQGVDKPNCHTPERTARNIVYDVEQGRSGQIWRGGMATTCWLTVVFAPQSVKDWMLNSALYKRWGDVTADTEKAQRG